jgi:outer membrane immunogenic protein
MRTLIVAGLFLSSVAAAHAADLAAAKMPYAPAPVSIPNWTGIYLGGFAGGSWVDGTFSGNGGFPPSQSFKESGFIGGIYLGYDYELANKFIFGGRLSVPLGSVNTTSTITSLAPDTVAPKMQWATMADLIFGYDMGQWEPYLGVGAIFVENKVTLAVAGNPTESNSELHPGLDVVAGVKYALTRNWAVGIQYNHDVIAQETYTFGPTFTASGQGSASVNMLSGTVEYRF